MFPRSQQVFIENRSVSPTFRANYQQVRQIKSYCKTKNIIDINFENKSHLVVQGRPISPQRKVIRSKIDSAQSPNYQCIKRQTSQLSNVRQINNQLNNQLDNIYHKNMFKYALSDVQTKVIASAEDTDFSMQYTTHSTHFEQEQNSKSLNFSLSFVTHKLMVMKKQNRMKFMLKTINNFFEKKVYPITQEDINQWLSIPIVQPQKYGLRHNMSILKDEREMAQNNIRQIQKSIEQNFLGKDFVVYLAMMKKQKRIREKQLDALDMQKDIFLEFSVIFTKVLFQVI